MNREKWVDIAKGIAIIAVVLGHIDFVYPSNKLLPLSDMLAEFWHVPSFFLIGGFFLKEEKLIRPFSFIKGKIMNLYLLLLYIYVPVLLLHNLFINIGFYDLQQNYSGKNVTIWNGYELLLNILKAIFFAGREPILGAMWFVYVLFLALCFMSILSWGLKKAIADNKRFEQMRFVLLLSLAILSCLFTNLYSLTIPRFSNVFTASWLIYVGMLINQRRRIQYSSGFVLSLCVILVFHLILLHKGSIALNTNKYDDVVMLTMSSLSFLYIICFFSKKIQDTYAGRVLNAVGKDSFYIMGLQFIGFKIGSIILNSVGCDVALASLKAPAGDNILFFVFYLLIGVFIPLVIISIVRYIRKSIVSFIANY